jgi:hypothetical protein
MQKEGGREGGREGRRTDLCLGDVLGGLLSGLGLGFDGLGNVRVQCTWYIEREKEDENMS